ncbi:MAG: methyltransferase domain-containing protein [Pseudomonadota bacterium]
MIYPSTLNSKALRRNAGRMSMRFALPLILLALLPVPATLAEAGLTSPNEPYQFGPASSDGIGKFYMGREISQVMGHLGAGWLERPTRVQEERTDLLLEMLDLKPGEIVADIGAGTGYFSLPMAGMVGENGRIFAVDIEPLMLAIIEERMVEENVSNIELVLATETNPSLPESEIDAVLMVDAYHEFAYPKEVMERVVESLSDNGRVILVEYRDKDPTVPIKPLHKMTVEQASREMAEVGLTLDNVYEGLPWQNVMVFRLPD